MADLLTILSAAAEHAGGHGAAEPTVAGLGAGWFVALSMTVLFLILVWKKVPTAITAGLDKSIAEIRHQLDEAKVLRAQAEALRKEYADKIANAEREAAEMLDHARHEAEAIVGKATSDTTDLIARREKMASEKIAAAELAALQDVRATAASAAATAASALIKAKHGADADRTLVDQAIAGIR
ncbi:MAG: hypothetical protein V4579_12600 [Pseudomonadota bacterium]